MFNRNTAAKKNSKKKEKELPIENMVVIWKDTVLEKQGSPAISGFGGRIYFHDSENQAVKAEGELVVYGFDDSMIDTGRSRKPSKKFVFTNEQFQTHYSESDIGASYSVWIPWEKTGGKQKNISLVAIFKTAEGKIINGGSSNNVLPGKKPENDGVIVTTNSSTRSVESGSVEQASYSTGKADSGPAQQAVLNEDTGAAHGIRSNTISLTPSMASLFSTPVAPQAIATPKSEPRTRSDAAGVNTFKPGQRSPAPSEPKSPAAPSSQNSGTKSEKQRSAPVFGVPGAFK